MRPTTKYECLKCLFYVVNTMIFGLALIMVCTSAIQVGKFIASKTDASDNINTRVKSYQTSGVLGLAMGIITIFHSLLGCFGIACSSRCLLCMYLIFSTLLLIVDLANMIYNSMEVNSFGSLDDQLLEVLKKYDGKKNEDTYYIDYNQVKFRCCGVDGFNDFEKTPWFKTKMAGQLVPLSCCQLKDELRWEEYSYETWELKKDDLMDQSCPNNPSGKANTIQPCVTLIEKKEKIVYVINIIVSIFSAVFVISMMAIAFKVKATLSLQ